MADKQRTVDIPGNPPKVTKRLITQFIIFGIAIINAIIALFTGNAETLVVDTNVVTEWVSMGAYLLPIVYGLFQGTSKKNRAKDKVSEQVDADAKEATKKPKTL